MFPVPHTVSEVALLRSSPERGVVDYRHRVFGYRNMYICDGSVVAANLGVNPSLTITALTERAMSFIPPAVRHRVGRRGGERFSLFSTWLSSHGLRLLRAVVRPTENRM